MNKEIIIQFNNLDIGSHSFDFEIDNEFFEIFDHHEFLNCNLKISVELIKDERLMTLNLAIKGDIEVECDRCLDALNIPIEIEETFYVKIGEYKDEDDTIIFISKDDIKIDLSSQVFDIVVLSLPMSKIHPDDENDKSTCNSKQLEYLSSNNEETIDPRWEALNELKMKNQK